MGWCSGTEIFDKVARFALDQASATDEQKEELLYTLAIALKDQDWDCEDDSDYTDHPIVKKIMYRMCVDKYGVGDCPPEDYDQ